MIRILYFCFFLFSASVFAFPEMTRHGYFNCITCHVSPGGGGVLTEYGRSLSKELLSTWGEEGEEKFLYGAVNESENLRLGGDIRGIQTYLDDPTTRQGDFFWMQSDLEIAATIKGFFVAGTAGTQGGPGTAPKKDHFLSRRHYVGYKFNDEWIVRAGKFGVDYGWNQPNHTIVTERGLDFDQGRETYNAEVAYIGEKINAHVTALTGRPDDPNLDGERGVAITTSIPIAERNVLGVSTLKGGTKTAERQLAGIFGLVALSEKFFWLFEYDHQWKQPSAVTEQKGVVTYNRLNYEAHQGINVYALHQIRYLNYHTPRNRMDAYGLGLQLFPRPHFELSAEFQKQRDISRFDTYYDYAFVLLHYYL